MTIGLINIGEKEFTTPIEIEKGLLINLYHFVLLEYYINFVKSCVADGDPKNLIGGVKMISGLENASLGCQVRLIHELSKYSGILPKLEDIIPKELQSVAMDNFKNFINKILNIVKDAESLRRN